MQTITLLAPEFVLTSESDSLPDHRVLVCGVQTLSLRDVRLSKLPRSTKPRAHARIPFTYTYYKIFRTLGEVRIDNEYR